MYHLAAAIGTGKIAPANARKLVFAYDYLGRRVEKQVYGGWDGTGYSATALTDRKFVYNGWNLVAEYDVLAANALKRSYTWGLDLTGSFAAAGGVGALVELTDHTANKSYYPAYDQNGNVVALVNDGGSLAAGYEYSAFGEPMRADVLDATVADNPWRYSTKYTDVETGLVYYGLRYYTPNLGRFVNRDPIQETGGLNLYGFCANNPVSRWDVLGLQQVCVSEFWTEGHDEGSVFRVVGVTKTVCVDVPDPTAGGGPIPWWNPGWTPGGTSSRSGGAPDNTGVSQSTLANSPSNTDLVPTSPGYTATTQQLLNALTKNSVVKGAMDQAWNNSNPNAPSPTDRKENGFWIYRSNSTGQIVTVEFPTALATYRRMDNIPLPPPLDGFTAIAFDHVHPNFEPEFFTGPSLRDENYANRSNIPGIIQAHDGIHYFGPSLPAPGTGSAPYRSQ